MPCRTVLLCLKNCVEFLSKEMPDIKIDDNCLFEEIRRLNVYLNSDKLEQWENQHFEINKRWVEIFNHFKNEHIPYENLVILVEFTLCCLELMQQLKEFFQLVMIFGQVRNQD